MDKYLDSILACMIHGSGRKAIAQNSLISLWHSLSIKLSLKTQNEKIREFKRDPAAEPRFVLQPEPSNPLPLPAPAAATTMAFAMLVLLHLVTQEVSGNRAADGAYQAMALLMPEVVSGRAAHEGRAEAALALGRIRVVGGVGILRRGIRVAIALCLRVVRIVGWLLLVLSLWRVAALLAVLIAAAR